MTDYNIPITVGNVTFKNPFYVASGPTTKSVKQLVRIEETGWAAASIKLSIDPAPYINRKPRYSLFEEYGALAFTAEKRLTFAEGLQLVSDAKKQLTDLLLMANITYAGDDDSTPAGWVNMARQFETAGADIIELNMCCPNMSYNVQLTSGGSDTAVKQTGASLGQQGAVVAEIVREIKKAVSIPLFVKLTPEGGQIAQVAHMLYAAGADAVGGTGNRLGIPPIDLDHPEKGIYHLQDEISMSCYSGGWLKPLALRDTYEMRKVCGDQPAIMATGGVANWRDAVEMILCGANLVGICAETLISGYDIVRPMIQGLREYMDEHGYKSPADFRSRLVPAVKTAPEVTLYGGYAAITEPNLYAPCKTACPIHVPAQAYVQKAAAGDFEGAYRMISSKGPLQRICAFACESPCETACVRGRVDAPVKIREIKRAVLDYARKNQLTPDYAGKPANGKRAAVVGSGAAGLAAAFELIRLGWAVTVYDQETEFGGSLRFATPHYRLEAAQLDSVIAELQEMGVRFEGGHRLGDDLKLETLRAKYDAVLLAIGRGKKEPCGLTGAEAPSVMDIYDFLRQSIKKPESLAGKRVVVAGSDCASLDAARCALRLGAREVILASPKTLPMQGIMLDAASEGVRLLGDAALRGFAANYDGLTAQFANAALPDALFNLQCDLAIFEHPRTVEASSVEGIALQSGHIAVDAKTFAASLPGVYCAGSAASNGTKTLVSSIAEGMAAAQAMDGGEAPAFATVKPADVLRRSGYIEPQRPAVIPPLVPAKERVGRFTLDTRAMTPQEAIEEAARCLNCGCGEGCQLCKTICCDFAPQIDGIDRLTIDKSECVACGMCYNRCPNHNIAMLSTGEKV